MTTCLWSYARPVAWRRHSATWHRWIDHLRSTLAPQLVKTHLPAWRTFTAVTWLLTLVTSTRQLVYKWITTEYQNDLLLTLSQAAVTQSLAAIDWLIDRVRLNNVMSHQTHYRSYQGQFLQVKWPNQQRQSTKGRSQLVNRCPLLVIVCLEQSATRHHIRYHISSNDNFFSEQPQTLSLIPIISFLTVFGFWFCV